MTLLLSMGYKEFTRIHTMLKTNEAMLKTNEACEVNFCFFFLLLINVSVSTIRDYELIQPLTSN